MDIWGLDMAFISLPGECSLIKGGVTTEFKH